MSYSSDAYKYIASMNSMVSSFVVKLHDSVAACNNNYNISINPEIQIQTLMNEYFLMILRNLGNSSIGDNVENYLKACRLYNNKIHNVYIEEFVAITFQDTSKEVKIPLSIIKENRDSYLYTLYENKVIDQEDSIYIDYDTSIGLMCMNLLINEDLDASGFSPSYMETLLNFYRFLGIQLPRQFMDLDGIKNNIQVDWKKEYSLRITFDGKSNILVNEYIERNNRIEVIMNKLMKNRCEYNYITRQYSIDIKNSCIDLLEDYIKNRNNTEYRIDIDKYKNELDQYNFQSLCSSIMIEEDYYHLYYSFFDELFDSTILHEQKETPRYIHQLREWVGEEKKWKLLFRASEHDYSSSEFHRYCDHHGETITLIRQLGHNSQQNIFGGYTSQNWENDTYGKYKTDNQAFIFTLQNEHAIPPTQYSVIHPENAIYVQSNSGPNFDNIVLKNYCNQNRESCCPNYSTYSHIHTTFNTSLFVNTGVKHRSNYFIVDEYEVYGLIE
ncbi:hypothetical protein WA158_001977 [Blastocystis sp. Blastoise]